MDRKLLEAPFQPDEIKARDGNFGKLHYVNGHSVIQRLNDAFQAEWSFEIAHVTKTNTVCPPGVAI